MQHAMKDMWKVGDSNAFWYDPKNMTGRGAFGTFVFEGFMKDKKVSVKRLLRNHVKVDLIDKFNNDFITSIIDCLEQTNILLYLSTEIDDDFL